MTESGQIRHWRARIADSSRNANAYQNDQAKIEFVDGENEQEHEKKFSKMTQVVSGPGIAQYVSGHSILDT